MKLEKMFRRVHANSANLFHGRSPLFEICNDLILAQSMPSGAVHPITLRRPSGQHGKWLLWVCAVKRRRFPVGASPTRRPLQPEATGAGMEVTKCLKPSDSGSRNTVTARVCRPQRE